MKDGDKLIRDMKNDLCYEIQMNAKRNMNNLVLEAKRREARMIRLVDWKILNGIEL